MQKIIRRRTEQAWHELITRQEKSGQSVQEFCRVEGLNAWTFYGWRSRLVHGAGKRDERPARNLPRQVAKPGAQFIDLGELRESASRCEIRLDLGGGVVLQVVRS